MGNPFLHQSRAATIPESTVYFHEVQLAGSTVLLEFHHRHAMPRQVAKHTEGMLSGGGIDRRTLSQDADTTRWRLLAQSAVTELADQPSSIEQHEDANARPDDTLLNE
jgi:hypothetical protein